MLAKTTITAWGETFNITLEKTKYHDGNLCIVAYLDTGEPWGKLSVNIPGISTPEIFVAKTYSENKAWATQVLKLPIFERVNLIQLAFNECEAYKLKS